MIAYLDTQTVIWLVLSKHQQISATARKRINSASELYVSPMVDLELQYVHEIGRLRLNAHEVLEKLGREIDLKVCGHKFSDVAAIARLEAWTRDPFDRVIVAQAKANGVAPLITSDERILKNYVNAVW